MALRRMMLAGKLSQIFGLFREWRDLKKRAQLIKVKDQEKPLEYVVYETHRGPIIHYLTHIYHLYEIQNENISLAWGGFRQFSTYSPTMVLSYITKDDHYGAQAIGPLVVRRNPYYGAYVKDGTNSEYDWIGILPSKSNIYVRDHTFSYDNQQLQRSDKLQLSLINTLFYISIVKSKFTKFNDHRKIFTSQKTQKEHISLSKLQL